ncbi:hypothetical protein FRC20_006979 [Serendipita sp. 405]|nr:hypothetical protein FRC20_006979 [Serendipita sp. 405]
MSQEVARSRTSLPAATTRDDETTAAATPNIVGARHDTDDMKHISTIDAEKKVDDEDVEVVKTGPDESELLTGKRLWVVWSAFLLYVPALFFFLNIWKFSKGYLLTAF